MSCHYHPDRPVARECRLCHELICEECVVLIQNDAVCKSCVAASFSLPNSEPVSVHQSQASVHSLSTPPEPNVREFVQQKSEALDREHKSGLLTVIFSCLPGLGHYYLGLSKRGLSLMTLFALLICVNVVIPRELGFPVGIGFPILWFYTLFDALKYKNLINQGVVTEDQPIFPQLARAKNSAWIGWGLTVLGGLVLLGKLFDLLPIDYFMRETIKELIIAALLIAGGIWILKGRSLPFGKEEREEENHA